jgi:hypothetical protein
MFEESVESFITRWRPYAADVTLFPHTEGSPLLECRAGDAIFGVLERTGPYAAHPGAAKLILHVMTESTHLVDEETRSIEVSGPSRIHANGIVLLRQGQMLVLDAGAPLVVGSFAPLPDELAAGNWVSLAALPPVHGFLVPKVLRSTLVATDSEI